MVQAKTKILINERVAKNIYRLTFEVPSFFPRPVPGQFVHVRIGDDFLPLLRRPFSISGFTEGDLTILYRVVGRGTEILSQLEKNQEVDLLGPLGQGFFIKKETREYLVVGGGMGIAPLLYLLQKLEFMSEKKISISLFAGFKSFQEMIIGEQFYKKNPFKTYLATEDGSYGYKGLISDVVTDYIKGLSSYQGIAIYACGPLPMLRIIAGLSVEYGIFCQVLLEQIIGCGVGACGGCVVQGVKGYLRVCKEGPVFNASDIAWDRVSS